MTSLSHIMDMGESDSNNVVKRTTSPLRPAFHSQHQLPLPNFSSLQSYEVGSASLPTATPSNTYQLPPPTYHLHTSQYPDTRPGILSSHATSTSPRRTAQPRRSRTSAPTRRSLYYQSAAVYYPSLQANTSRRHSPMTYYSGSENPNYPGGVPPRLTPVTGRLSRAKKGLPVHVCDMCNPPRTFTRAEHLRRHQLSHGEPQFPCEYHGCSKSFHRHDLRQRHHERHQFEGDEQRTSLSSARNSTGGSHGTSQTPRHSSSSSSSTISMSSAGYFQPVQSGATTLPTTTGTVGDPTAYYGTTGYWQAAGAVTAGPSLYVYDQAYFPATAPDDMVYTSATDAMAVTTVDYGYTMADEYGHVNIPSSHRR